MNKEAIARATMSTTGDDEFCYIVFCYVVQQQIDYYTCGLVKVPGLIDVIDMADEMVCCALLVAA
jgi:hypothetical protein